MQNFFKENKDTYNSQKEKKVKEYIKRYFIELQRHFDVSDSQMRNIIHEIYKELSPCYLIKKIVKEKLYMLKSFYKDILKTDKN